MRRHVERFLGMSLAHSRAHMTRAVLEGICFALNDSLTILRELGLSPEQLLLTGGGARSPLIRRLQSEIFGVPVTTSNREEGPAYGAALLAAVGVGVFPDLVSAARQTIERAPPSAPDPAAVAAYTEPYARFRASFASSLQR
jgi:xylulokinase